jgi:hypothetical protein
VLACLAPHEELRYSAITARKEARKWKLEYLRLIATNRASRSDSFS